MLKNIDLLFYIPTYIWKVRAMGYIYIVKNFINEKVYIGQTIRNIETRWKEHLRHSDSQDQPLYRAMQKYGKQNFYIQQLEECPDIFLNERESYWIKYFDSYNNGYNATLGGQDNFIMTSKIEQVLNLWCYNYTINKIVEKTGLNVETVRSYLNKNGITHEDIRARANKAISKSRSKPILQYDLQGNFIREWRSSMEVERELSISHNNIGSVCNGKRKTAGGYIWKHKGD